VREDEDGILAAEPRAASRGRETVPLTNFKIYGVPHSRGAPSKWRSSWPWRYLDVELPIDDDA